MIKIHPDAAATGPCRSVRDPRQAHWPSGFNTPSTLISVRGHAEAASPV
jgi:hypothetical protein